MATRHNLTPLGRLSFATVGVFLALNLCSAAPDTTALVRIHYPAGGHAVTVRGSAA